MRVSISHTNPITQGLAFLYAVDNGAFFISFTRLPGTVDGLGDGITYALHGTGGIIPEHLVGSIDSSIVDTSAVGFRDALTSIQYKPWLTLAGLQAWLVTRRYNVIIARLRASISTKSVHRIRRTR